MWIRLYKYKIQLFFVLIISVSAFKTAAQSNEPNELVPGKSNAKKYEQFYDSLEYKAKQKKLTRIIYDFLVSPPRAFVDKEAVSLEYYSQLEGKIISEISIKPLDVFGPTFEDTTRTAKSWLERTANKVHTKSNLNTIEKMLLFKVGDFVDADLMYENERIIRSLPYIQDVKIVLEQDSVYKGLVKVSVLTKDRFSVGVSGGVDGGQSAALEVYNQNIFGIGHEISFRFVGHLNKQPYTGLETFYKIKNFKGKFVDISAGYTNTYLREGFSFNLDKPFIIPSIKWGFGGSAQRMFRTDRVLDNDPIKTQESMDLAFLSAWGGRSFQLKPGHFQNSQMVLSAGIYNRTYFHRPSPATDGLQYFSNSTFYLAGLTFSQRRYMQDQLVYSYGITEDIPEGFKNELVFGYDANEFGDRYYAHLYFSNGNLLVKRQGYLFLSGGVGGYFKDNRYEQGQVQAGLNFISRQIPAGRKRFRLFARANYMLGIRRFEIENLTLNRNDHIRGFSSREAAGKQRLSLDLEYVLFLRKQFYKFNMAAYGFADVGIIGSNKNLIFTEHYYSGLGLGIRIHNENLVFKTFHLRLGFYPFPPSDMSFVGVILEEQLKKDFYSFTPTAPQPLRFE
ncbi:hypothetical protein SAMN05444274_103108 [Mariniphaga anaerophila]|uniref:Surface antigen n=1 Tax=Mariniphaga anaerophila TaxID=1484053 RepID=A0A1M4XST9_9BACT|nr:hypothetical protein [Mariniphaga anaerophila]SHE96515.1 hypothetical protein SAMN05444274_103108 [Mariniphaga anaerophila]